MRLQQAIEQASNSVSRRDAETLLQHMTGRSRASLLAHPEADLPAAQHAAYLDLVARRAAHVPLQYLTGHQEFFGLDLQVTPAVLIPRPETELLVEAVLHWLDSNLKHQAGCTRIVDIGTGSGAIALALASRLPQAEVHAVDLSPDALRVARANAQHLGLRERVRFSHSDLLRAFSELPEADRLFDAVVSNPPYVPQADAEQMQPEVRDHEPHLALFAGTDGLTIYRRLIPEAMSALRPRGLLALEFGFGQKAALQELLSGWDRVRFLDDYAGIPRIALAERP